jgi:hypothetical protein
MTDEQIWKELEWLQLRPGDFKCGSTPKEILDNGIKIIKLRDNNYNCLSHAIGKINDFLWPEEDLLKEMDEYVYEFGYKRYKKINLDFSNKVKKFVVFEKKGFLTHVSLRVDDGWESKLGRGAVIFHNNLELISGEVYGQPKFSYYKKICSSIS